MKTAILAMVAGVLLAAQSQQSSVPSTTANSQYFPAKVFDAGGESFKDKWYSDTLRSLQEPSLFALRNDPSLQVYRFLWLPSFHRPISVRLTINADGSGSIVTRSVDSRAGLLTKPASDTGKLIRDTTSAIDKVHTQELLERLHRIVFWSMPPEEEQLVPQPSGTSSGDPPKSLTAGQ